MAETLSSPSEEVRCGSLREAIWDAATAVAVPEPKPPTIAPSTTSGSEVVRAAQPYPVTARTSPRRAQPRAPNRSTRPASEKPAEAELSSRALPTRPA